MARDALQYAVHYQDVQPTLVATWKREEEPEEIELKTFEDKLTFLKGIRKGDTLYTELGGGGGVFSLVALRNGARVFRVAPHILKDACDRWGFGKTEIHNTIAFLARSGDAVFYPMREVDEAVVELGVIVRGRRTVQQQVRIPTGNRLKKIFKDEWLVEKPKQDIALYLKEQLARNPIFAGADEYEKKLTRRIEKILKRIPVYDAIFKPIRGCGPIIGGTVIARMTDIRRFETADDLKAYAGYHLDQDGNAPKRHKGQRANWDAGLRQAVWLFTDVTMKQPEDTPWKAALLQRLTYEKKSHPKPVKVSEEQTLYTPHHLYARAKRWLGQQFLEQVWREWRAFEGL